MYFNSNFGTKITPFLAVKNEQKSHRNSLKIMTFLASLFGIFYGKILPQKRCNKSCCYDSQFCTFKVLKMSCGIGICPQHNERTCVADMLRTSGAFPYQITCKSKALRTAVKGHSPCPQHVRNRVNMDLFFLI